MQFAYKSWEIRVVMGISGRIGSAQKTNVISVFKDSEERRGAVGIKITDGDESP